MRPPLSTPAALSMKLVVEDVPASAPTRVAPESASRAGRNRGSLPSAPTRPARVATPTNVPAVSKTSTRSIVRITVSIDRLSALAMSSLNSTGAGDGGSAATPWNGAPPNTQPATAMPSMPMTTAPATLRAARPTMAMNPAKVAAGPNETKSPKDTRVASSSTMMPALRRPTSAMNKPMPAAMPSFRLRGIASTSHWRTGSTLKTTNSTPERNTAPKAVCQ